MEKKDTKEEKSSAPAASSASSAPATKSSGMIEVTLKPGFKHQVIEGGNRVTKIGDGKTPITVTAATAKAIADKCVHAPAVAENPRKQAEGAKES